MAQNNNGERPSKDISCLSSPEWPINVWQGAQSPQDSERGEQEAMLRYQLSPLPGRQKSLQGSMNWHSHSGEKFEDADSLSRPHSTPQI